MGKENHSCSLQLWQHVMGMAGVVVAPRLQAKGARGKKADMLSGRRSSLFGHRLVPAPRSKATLIGVDRKRIPPKGGLGGEDLMGDWSLGVWGLRRENG